MLPEVAYATLVSSPFGPSDPASCSVEVGASISHTEWHRCVVFGKLSEFAKTLPKGAHIQVEGELRSREYASKKTGSKQRVWEIRVASILKLDRAEKAAPEDQDHDEVPQEETAA